MRFYISKPYFYFILVLIILLPLSKKSHLLIYGKRTTGIVTEYGNIEGNAINERFPGPYNVSIITFKVKGSAYMLEGPLNIYYDTGKKIKVVYDKENPRNNTLLTFTSLYSGYGFILAGFILMVWMAYYLTYGSFKRKASEHKNQPGNRKQLE